MRFRSLVISWCVCAIYGSVRIASGHRSHDATLQSTFHPPGDIETPSIHSPKNISNLSPPGLLPSVSRPRSPSRYAMNATSPAGVDNRSGNQKLVKLMTRATTEKIVESSTRRGSRRKRRKKCSRKRDGKKRTESPMLKRKEWNGSIILKNRFISVGAKNFHASTLNSTSKSTTPQRFMDIIFTTTAVPSTVDATTITEAAKITLREADDPTDKISRRSSPRKRCKKIKCMPESCKKKRKIAMTVIDVLDQGLLGDDDLEKASRTQSSSLENVELQAIVE